ncbi:hypothetical protein W97_07844 [Coniosporium apollinis CBS 100218]|uniref:Uncharacterized protein n=1 Tax=Coniosporium apollinis (strain CBS 100218) TaxID=1168221 RepID=R7Z3W9_CONA1|nr:uncharacterized protein W97_07844 [Coniosporium apollinis CBS 100218]EON68586.1 hypothetical protein W97_07844 [Coniosporium apollinis CBS 100218]
MNKLREINIQIQDSEWSWRSALWSRPDWAKRLRRDSGARIGAVHQITVTCGKAASKYWVASHQVKYLPKDPKREGCDRSEVLVGFPIDDSREMANEAARQLVYAFLPVGDFGFKFMIQADFLLVANRENLDSCSWNDALVEAIPYSFLRAIQEFNEGNHRYDWLKYLPDIYEQFRACRGNHASSPSCLARRR